MLQLLELLPLAAFYLTYRYRGHVVALGDWHYTLDGLYSATAVLMAGTLLQVLVVWLWKRRVEKRLLGLLAIVWLFGGATLAFRNQLFIQWKPTIWNWGLCAVVLGSHLLGKSLVARLLGSQWTLPDAVIRRVTWLWVAYLFIVGALNLVVAYHFSQATWVSYKLWSSILYTLAISVATGLLLAPHLGLNREPTKPEQAP